MTTSTATATAAANLLRVIPWEAMTPTQQAEHLVHAHGLGADYFTIAEVPALANLTDAQIVQAWVDPHNALGQASQGNSYPHHSARDSWHEQDHHEYPADGGPLDDHLKHTHDKPAGR